MADSTEINIGNALAYAQSAAEKLGLDPDLVGRILLTENMGKDGKVPTTIRTDSTSPRGAVGLMQVMPDTRKALQQQGFLPETHDNSTWMGQIDAGIASLRETVKRIGSGSPEAIAADYNAGPRGSRLVNTGQPHLLASETQNYLKKFAQAGDLLGGGQPGDFTQTSSSSPNGTPKTSTSTTNYPGLEAAARIVATNGAVMENLISSIFQGGEAEKTALAGAAIEITKAGEANAAAERTKGEIEGAAAETRKRILQILNLDTSNADNAIAQNLATFAELGKTRQPISDDIDKRNAVGFFDNPIQWLINQTVLPGEVAQHNALAQKQNQILRTTSYLQNAAKEQEGIDVAATADQYARLAADMATARVSTAKAEAARFTAQAAGTDARIATTVANIRERQADNEVKIETLRRVVTNDRLEADKTAQQKTEEATLDADIKRIGLIIGAPNASLQTVKRMTKVDQDMWMSRVAKNSAGDNLWEALTFFTKFGNIQNMNNTGNAELGKVLRNIQSAVAQQANADAAQLTAQGQKLPPRAEMLESAANRLESVYFGQREDMLKASPTNPYLADHTSAAMAWKGDPNNPVVKLLLDANKNKVKLNDQQLVSAIIGQVDKMVLSPLQATGALADYYQHVIRTNNRNRAFNLMGMSLQDDYSVLLKENSRKLDLTNTVALENFFTKRKIIGTDLGYGFDPMGTVDPISGVIDKNAFGGYK
jgi:hypothetical protein